MSDTTATLPATGDTVRYHGSLTDSHGTATVVCGCNCARCWEAPHEGPFFIVRPVAGVIYGDLLVHVRAASLTVIQ